MKWLILQNNTNDDLTLPITGDNTEQLKLIRCEENETWWS